MIVSTACFVCSAHDPSPNPWATTVQGAALTQWCELRFRPAGWRRIWSSQPGSYFTIPLICNCQAFGYPHTEQGYVNTVKHGVFDLNGYIWGRSWRTRLWRIGNMSTASLDPILLMANGVFIKVGNRIEALPL